MNRGEYKMKDIKSYVIGFLTCACLFLIMGQTIDNTPQWVKEMKSIPENNPENTGKYQIAVTVDPENEIEELKEKNNVAKSNVIRISDIKLLLPTDKFTFEENGLFLFQWDSLAFSEFKIQVGVDEKFEDSGSFFDLPQGNRWIADKELVPLAGELPGMAMGLMIAKEKNQLFWRVIGRQASGRQAISGIRRFSITQVRSDSS